MGAGFSGLIEENIEGPTLLKPGLGDVPENCVALVLTHLDPPEICKLAELNRVFRQASLADCVWESKLPENYPSLAHKLFDEGPQRLAKKDIYARLCHHNGFDGGTKEVWMEKRNGGICVQISWKGMKITGIDDRRYWNHIPSDESRFQKIAYLQQIWWLEVDGNLEFEFPRGTYSLYFRLQLGKTTKKLGRRVCNLDQVHGWGIKPVRFQFSTSNGQKAMSQCYLKEAGKWLHHHVGDFAVENPTEPTKIKFSMTQIDCTHTKGGLCLDSVLILPNISNVQVVGRPPLSVI
ncbi:F-box protein PP2-A13-like isoform X2 [Actinidia eriantha]|uniref:F-box protein PP2-A13-like isoform X2 n=1 Tax=Actinidia eriantha TaxID=165200 RepID=UPI00258AF802|nr:F-box protein PP2-A13-like isoform X2 [Actinidia eriantha]